jgi:hypothetical protein
LDGQCGEHPDAPDVTDGYDPYIRHACIGRTVRKAFHVQAVRHCLSKSKAKIRMHEQQATFVLTVINSIHPF